MSATKEFQMICDAAGITNDQGHSMIHPYYLFYEYHYDRPYDGPPIAIEVLQNVLREQPLMKVLEFMDKAYVKNWQRTADVAHKSGKLPKAAAPLRVGDPSHLANIARNYRALFREKYKRDTVLDDAWIIDSWQETRAMNDQDSECLMLMREQERFLQRETKASRNPMPKHRTKAK